MSPATASVPGRDVLVTDLVVITQAALPRLIESRKLPRLGEPPADDTDWKAKRVVVCPAGTV
jgi:hypothetical protein